LIAWSATALKTGAQKQVDNGDIGDRIYKLAVELFPFCRSITGNGVRETLKLIRRELPDLRIHEVPSGTKCFDWTVPPEWNITDAFIIDPDGNKLADFQKSNLHVVGYSVPVDKTISREQLEAHLHSIPDQPDAVPYVTSYYEERWGFCLTHRERERLKPGQYRVFIGSTLEPGSLTYGELIIPGKSEDEVFLSTYICHPSLANNELSGPTVTTYLAKWISGLRQRCYTYRIIFVPETIGSITYLSHNLDHLKRHVVAGFNVTCVGDERSYSYVPSRAGDTLADRVALYVLKHLAPDFVQYTYLDRGSDERQYCSPGVDLPVVSVMRTKYREYPEYHTSKDDLTLISPSGLFGGYEALRHCLLCIEHNETLQVTVLGEPQMGKRGMYKIGSKGRDAGMRRIMNLLAYCDGRQDLLSVAETIGEPMWELSDVVSMLKEEGLLKALR